MFERLNTPQEAFNFKLGAALTMERTDDETHTLAEVRRLQAQVAAVTPKQPAEGGVVADKIKSALT
jgi:hypothetical protein